MAATLQPQRWTIMRIFIFKSAAKGELRAFAGEAGGQKLPSNLGPWHAIGVIREDKAPPFNVSTIGTATAMPGAPCAACASTYPCVAVTTVAVALRITPAPGM